MYNNKIVCDCDAIHEDILARVREGMASREAFERLAMLFKMFDDPTRVKILWALKCHEMCVCDLAVLLNMTKSAISHQLKTLRMANLVRYRKEGKVVYYSLADAHVLKILAKGFEHINE